MAGDHREHPGEREGPDDDPKERLREFFRFHPIRFYDHVAAEVERREGAKQKRDYITDWARVIVKPWLRVAAAAIALAVAGRGVWELSTHDADHTVAIFTVVLAIVAMVQWWTTHGQLRQARTASHQTDQMVEQMRLEQRPWVGISKPNIHVPDDPGDVFRLEYVLRNSGKTPAMEIGMAVTGVTTTPGPHAAAFARENALVTDSTVVGMAIIAPGGEVKKVTSYKLSGLTPEILAGIKDGRYRHIMCGVFKYTSTGDAEYSTGFMFTLHTDGQVIVEGGPEDNYMR